MIATALLGTAMAAQGTALIGSFHAAAWVAATCAAAAGIAALVLIDVKPQKEGS